MLRTRTTTSDRTEDASRRTSAAIRDLMAEHDPILLFASNLLTPSKAADASALYAWCRRLDEICDDESDNAAGNYRSVRARLGVWQDRFDALWTTSTTNKDDEVDDDDYAEDEYLMDLALRDCIEKYQGGGDGDPLTRIPFDDMIEGMKSDAVEGRRIETMEELELYAYRVAGTVGLMLLPLLLSDNDDTDDGDDDNNSNKTLLDRVEKAREPAISLGKAIQLVNILRDATQDAKLGRIYLPRDMLRAEGVDDDDRILAAAGATTEGPPAGYREVVRAVSGRARELLSEAEDGRTALPGPLGPLFVQIIVELYRDYLEELRRRDYDNLTAVGGGRGGGDRVRISTPRKVLASLRAVAAVVAG